MNRASSPTGWVRNPDGSLGWTCNPITGCLNHVDGMCKGGNFPCYAYRLAHGRLRQRYLANTNFIDAGHLSDIGRLTDLGKRGEDPFYPRIWPERLAELTPKRTKGKGIFLCDMSDLFGLGIPNQWTEDCLDMAQKCTDARFYLLTKQPQNLIKFSPFPDNCWVGVTATDGASFDKAVCHLAEVAANIKYISFEPLLGSVFYDEKPFWGGAEWLIIGTQTKPTVYPRIDWVEEIEAATAKAGIPVFEKDNLIPLLRRELTQEFPNG